MSVLGTYYFGDDLPDHCEFGGDPNPDASVRVHIASTASERLVWVELERYSTLGGLTNSQALEDGCGAAFDLDTAKQIAAALNRWIAAHDKAEG